MEGTEHLTETVGKIGVRRVASHSRRSPPEEKQKISRYVFKCSQANMTYDVREDFTFRNGRAGNDLRFSNKKELFIYRRRHIILPIYIYNINWQCIKQVMTINEKFSVFWPTSVKLDRSVRFFRFLIPFQTKLHLISLNDDMTNQLPDTQWFLH